MFKWFWTIFSLGAPAWSDRVVFAVYTKVVSQDGACHAFLYLESLRREDIFC